MVEQPRLLRLATMGLMQFKDEPVIVLCSLHLYFDQFRYLGCHFFIWCPYQKLRLDITREHCKCIAYLLIYICISSYIIILFVIIYIYIYDIYIFFLGGSSLILL